MLSAHGVLVSKRVREYSADGEHRPWVQRADFVRERRGVSDGRADVQLGSCMHSLHVVLERRRRVSGGIADADVGPRVCGSDGVRLPKLGIRVACTYGDLGPGVCKAER